MRKAIQFLTVLTAAALAACFIITRLPSTSASGSGGRYSNGRISLGYVPNGFDLAESESHSDNVYLTFKNADSGLYFTLIASGPDSSRRIDTEDAEVERLTVNGCDGLYIVNAHDNILVWCDDSYTYALHSNTDKEDTVKIAENIQPSDSGSLVRHGINTHIAHSAI